MQSSGRGRIASRRASKNVHARHVQLRNSEIVERVDHDGGADRLSGTSATRPSFFEGSKRRASGDDRNASVSSSRGDRKEHPRRKLPSPGVLPFSCQAMPST